MKATNITLTKQDYGRVRVGYFFGNKQRWRYFTDIKKADKFIGSVKSMRLW